MNELLSLKEFLKDLGDLLFRFLCNMLDEDGYLAEQQEKQWLKKQLEKKRNS